MRPTEFEDLRLRDSILHEMSVHLIAIEIRVVRLARRVIHAQRALSLQHAHAMSHDRRLVQGRLPVHQQHVPGGQVPQDLQDGEGRSP